MENIISIKDVALVSPLIAVFIASLFPIGIKVLRGNKEQSSVITLFQALLGIGVAIALILTQAADTSVSAFVGALRFDGASKSMSIVVCLIAALSLFISHGNVNTKGRQFSEHVFLMLNALIGMFVMIWANDLIVVFIGLEIMSLALYMLVALSHEQKLAKEAAFKYFILGSLASAIFLYGVALLYGSVGSTYFDQVTEIAPSAIGNDTVFIMGSLLTLVGMLFKVSIFPFHSWTPDVYQGAPTSLTAFMSTGVKIASFAVILRFVSTGVISDMGGIFEILQWLAVLTMLVGNIAAIVQDNFKRILAYSSVAHSGYILVGVIVTGLGAEANIGYSSTLFYLFTYALVNIGLLSLISNMESKEESTVMVQDLRGLANKRPGLSLVITVLLLSLAGIPPLAGFFGKFYLFAGAIDMGLYWLALWGVVNSVISVYYYLRPIVMMYMKEAEEGQEEVKPELLSYLNIGLTFGLVIFLGIFSGNLFEYLKNIGL
ncbi:MAG: NADH-quinone oxidoreductase subunit N [Bdellovibrionota bacterium]|nr:NADH-quinone oxidoreductase subunit N [Bdellovibrionota bacterium]